MSEATFDRVPWPLRTGRLTIRPATTADLPAVFAVRSHPEVARWMPSFPSSYDDWLLGLGRSGAVERTLVVVLDGAVIGAGSLVAALSLVQPGMQIPPGVLAAGVPAVVKRPLAGTPAEMWVKLNPTYYPALAQRHIAGIRPV